MIEVLEANSRGGRSGLKEAKSVFDKFLEWKWEELLHLSESKISTKLSSSSNQSKQAALRLIQCGKLSRAARVLTSVGLAPASEETVQKLEKKHPKRSEKIPAVSPPVNSTPISLSKALFLKVIHQSPRGSGA